MSTARGFTIRPAESEQDVCACFSVVKELRGHLEREEFLRRVRLQRSEGYVLACLREGGEVRAVAGFRLLHNLHAGRVLHVDDLVTASAHRSRGCGAALMRWLVEQARTLGCHSLQLDSGVQRFEAHRFYLLQRLEIRSHHFCLPLHAPD